MTDEIISTKKLKSLIPFDSLGEEKLLALSKIIFIESATAETTIFTRGENDQLYYYLLQGVIMLTSLEDNLVEVENKDDEKKNQYLIKGETEAARYQLDTHQTHRSDATAKTDILYIKVHHKIIASLLSQKSEQLNQNDEFWVNKLLTANIFKNLPGQHIHHFIKRMELYPVNPGSFVIKQGEQGDYYYFIISGQFEVIKQNKPNGPAIKITELSEWNGFGEEAVVANQTRNASIRATTDGVLMRLPQAEFITHILRPLIYHVTYQKAHYLIENGAIWLDVRNENEYERGHLEHSHNLPLPIIRSVIKRLNPKMNYITCCDTGSRSSAAAFILFEAGYNIYVLDGGFISTGKIPLGLHNNSVDPFTQPSKANQSPDSLDAQLKASIILDSARQEAERIKIEANNIKQQANKEAVKIKNLAKEDINKAQKVLSMAKLKDNVYKQWIDERQEKDQEKTTMAIQKTPVILILILIFIIASVIYFDEIKTIKISIQLLQDLLLN